MPLAAKIGEWVALLQYEDLSPNLITQAKRALFDAVGAIQAGGKSDAGRDLLKVLPTLFGSGSVSIPGTGVSSTVAGAALAAGTFAEVYEVTDGYKQGGCHPGSVVVPAALAMQQEIQCTSEEFITAVVAGYEVMLAIAEISHPAQTWQGFAPTGTCGSFGAAACASRMLGLGSLETTWALGTAGFISPFSLQAAFFKSTVKPLHAGQAALSGVQAAYLAREGFTGPEEVLEGEKGFWAVSPIQPNLPKVIEGLGTRMDNLYFKPYPTCRHTHAGLDAVLALRREGGFELSQIEQVEIGVHQLAASIVNQGAITAGALPVQCQFSLPYLAAAALVDGAVSLRQLTPERIDDPVIQGLASKIKITPNDKFTKWYPEMTISEATIQLCTGRELSRRIDYPKGDPLNRLSDEELVSKYAGLTGDAVGNNSRKVWESINEMNIAEFINSTKGDVDRCQNLQQN